MLPQCFTQYLHKLSLLLTLVAHGAEPKIMHCNHQIVYHGRRSVEIRQPLEAVCKLTFSTDDVFLLSFSALREKPYEHAQCP